MYIHQLIKQVYEKFRGLPVRLAERHNLSEEWFRSHGYPPKTLDPFGSGNPCPEVEGYFKKVEEFEAAQAGSGQMLNQLVYTELNCRFQTADDYPQRELTVDLLKEATEAVAALTRKDFSDSSINDLNETSKELCDLAELVNKSLAIVSREIKKREVRSNVFADMSGHGKYSSSAK